MDNNIELETLTAKQHYMYNIEGCSSLLSNEKEKGCCLMLDNKLNSKLLIQTKFEDNIIYNLDTNLLFKSLVNHPKYNYIINLIISIYDKFNISSKKEINELVKYLQISKKLGRSLNDNELLESFNISLDSPKLDTVEVLYEVRCFLYFIYAYQTLFNSNLRLVINIAGKYNYDEQLDLIDEGNIALMKAIDRFDRRKGKRFSTYATYHIWQAIHDSYYINRGPIVIPPNNESLVKKFLADVRRLEEEENKSFTREELSERLNIPLSTVHTYYSSIPDYVQLDKPVGENQTSCAGDFIPSPDSYKLDNVFLESDIEALFKDLSERDREMYRKYKGIGTDFEYSLEDLAKEYNVTKQRIGQIIKRAESKVNDMPKHNVKAYYLKEYL